MTGQPANSPDTNINDLIFFRALQARQWNSVENAREDPYGLILAVTTAFQEFEPRLLKYNFLTLQTCLEQIILSHGDNIYAIPHMGKERLDNMEMLPLRIKASMEAMVIACDFLEGDGGLEVLDADVESSKGDELSDDGLSGNENGSSDGEGSDDHNDD